LALCFSLCGGGHCHVMIVVVVVFISKVEGMDSGLHVHGLGHGLRPPRAWIDAVSSMD